MGDAALFSAVAPDRLAAVLGCGVSAGLVGRLSQSPRVWQRAAEYISQRLGDVGTLSREQARALAMRPDELIDLANRAGAIWHRGAIARIIDARARRSLVEMLGEKNYALSMAHGGLEPPGTAAELAPEDIAAAIPADGAACLAVWCEAQHHAVAERLRLTRPVASPERAHEMWGQPIVIRLLADQ
jgi:hypothetical protein